MEQSRIPIAVCFHPDEDETEISINSAMGVKLPFGMRASDRRLVDAYSVPNGAACGCVCPACDGKLIARNKGQFKIEHFAHGTDCGDAYQTAVHETAKQIIRELGFVWLPESILGPKKKFEFTSNTLEKKYDTVVPDVMVWCDPNRRLAIEVFVTHAVDAVKLAKLRAMNLACVEYDLSDLDRDVTYEHLRTAFQTGSLSARWVYSRRIEEAERKAELLHKRQAAEAQKERLVREQAARAEQEKINARLRAASVTKKVLRAVSFRGEEKFHVPDCPMQIRSVDGQTFFANVELDCQQCRFCYGISRKPGQKFGPLGNPLRVTCAGLVEELRRLWPMNEWRDVTKARVRW